MYKNLGETEKTILIKELYKILLLKKLKSNDYTEKIRYLSNYFREKIKDDSVCNLHLSNEDIKSIKVLLNGIDLDYDYPGITLDDIENIQMLYNCNLIGLNKINCEFLSLNTLCDVFDYDYTDIYEDDLSKIIGELFDNFNVDCFSSIEVIDAISEKNTDLIDYFGSLLDLDNYNECTSNDLDEYIYHYVIAIFLDDKVDLNIIDLSNQLIKYDGDIYGGSYKESFFQEKSNSIILSFSDTSFIHNLNFWETLKKIKMALS